VEYQANDILPVAAWRELSRQQFRRVTAALHQKEFRYFLAGAFLSNIGSWMQSVAQAWLVLQLTGSAFYLGLDGFANTLPLAFFAPWGGVIADRFDRRRLLLLMQWIQLTLALGLGILVQLRLAQVWHVLGFSVLLGCVQSVAWPVYQTFLGSMVKSEDLSNAVALNSTQFNLSRMIGPVIGALALGALGTAGCFYANAISFGAVIIALGRIHLPRDSRLPESHPSGYLKSLKEGLAYVTGTRGLYWLLLTLAAASVLGVPLVTLLPVYARDILRVGAIGLGYLIAAFGGGAVLGGVLIAYLGDFQRKGRFALSAILFFVVAMLGFAVCKSLAWSLVFLALAGFSMVSYVSVINTVVQCSVPDHLRGRAISLFVISFGGFMPFGNLLAGWLAKEFGAPTALVGQGVTLGVLTLFVFISRPDVHSLS
jgi:MFS family permease